MGSPARAFPCGCRIQDTNANNLSKSGEAEIKVLVELFQKLAESYMKNDVFHVRQRLLPALKPKIA